MSRRGTEVTDKFILRPQRFARRAGSSNYDSHEAVQKMLDEAMAITASGNKRRVECQFPPGDYYVDNLYIRDVDGASSLTTGQMVLKGSGEQNVKLIGTASSGNVLTVKSGKVMISDLTVTANQTTRGVTTLNSNSNPSAKVGTGDGIVLDASDISTVSVAKLVIKRVGIFLQPGHGFRAVNSELATLEQVGIAQCWQDAFRFEGTTANAQINNVLTQCRATRCRGRALSELTGGHGGIYIAFEALLCDGEDDDGAADGYHIYSVAAHPFFLGLDMEGANGNLDAAVRTQNLIGAIFGSVGAQVIGGTIHGFRTNALKFTGASGRVVGTQISNSSEKALYSMTAAIDAANATGFYADIPTIAAVGTSGITAAFNPAVPADGSGNVYRHGNFAPESAIGGSSTVQYVATRASADSTSAAFRARKARGDITTPTVISANDIVALWQGAGYDGTNYQPAVNEYHQVIAATPSATDMQGRWALHASPSGTVVPTEVATIDHTSGLRLEANIVIDANRHFRLRSYTVAQVNAPLSASPAGMAIYVSDGAGNKRLAISDGTNWRFPDGNVVS